MSCICHSNFLSQKRRAVWRLVGDIRGEGAAILLRLWNALAWPIDENPDAQTLTRYGVRCRTKYACTVTDFTPLSDISGFVELVDWTDRESLFESP